MNWNKSIKFINIATVRLPNWIVCIISKLFKHNVYNLNKWGFEWDFWYLPCWWSGGPCKSCQEIANVLHMLTDQVKLFQLRFTTFPRYLAFFFSDSSTKSTSIHQFETCRIQILATATSASHFIKICQSSILLCFIHQNPREIPK